MITKKNKFIAEILKDWYFIDSVLLNGHAKHVITDDKDYQSYISLKEALLSDIAEFYGHIDYDPVSSSIPKNVKHLQEMAVKDAKKSKSISAKLLESKVFKRQLKSSVISEFKKNQSRDLVKVSDSVINDRFLKMTLDNMLIGKPVIECKKKDLASDFKGSILEQAYMTVRGELIKIASKYNSSIKK